MIELSIIIPCYNEGESIKTLFAKVLKVISIKDGVEIIFVNNGSTDNTQETLLALIKNSNYQFLKCVKVEINKGYGYGILQGLNAANGEILAWTHADLQTNPIDIIDAYNKYEILLKENKCIVKGNRKNRNFFDNFFTFGMSCFASLILCKKVWDINAQPKIFNRTFFYSLKNPPFDFSLDLFILYSAIKNNINIKSFPVLFEKRLFGQAKGGGTLKGKFKLIKRTLIYILKLKKNH